MIDHEFLGNIIVNSTTITPIEWLYLDGVSSNTSIQRQVNSKANKSGYTSTFTESAQLNDAINFNATLTQLGANINQYASAIIFQDNGGSTSGTRVFKLIEFFDKISQTSLHATNKFTQTILTGDVNSNNIW